MASPPGRSYWYPPQRWGPDLRSPPGCSPASAWRPSCCSGCSSWRPSPSAADPGTVDRAGVEFGRRRRRRSCRRRLRAGRLRSRAPPSGGWLPRRRAGSGAGRPAGRRRHDRSRLARGQARLGQLHGHLVSALPGRVPADERVRRPLRRHRAGRPRHRRPGGRGNGRRASPRASTRPSRSGSTWTGRPPRAGARSPCRSISGSMPRGSSATGRPAGSAPDAMVHGLRAILPGVDVTP